MATAKNRQLTYVKMPSHSNQFWDPSNSVQKMLVGKNKIFEVESTATIQQAISVGALSQSSKDAFDKQGNEEEVSAAKTASKSTSTTKK